MTTIKGAHSAMSDSSRNIAQPQPKPRPVGEPWAVLVEKLKKQEREAVRLRELGQVSASIERFRAAVNLCDDAFRRFGSGPMAEVWGQKKMQLQEALNALVVVHGRVPPTQRAPQTLLPLAPAMASKARPDTAAVPRSRRVGFVTKLNLEEATWDEYMRFSRNLLAEADVLQHSDWLAAAAKLREAAGIWDYAANSSRFQFFANLSPAAREMANALLLRADALEKGCGVIADAANEQSEPPDTQAEARPYVEPTPTPAASVGGTSNGGAEHDNGADDDWVHLTDEECKEGESL